MVSRKNRFALFTNGCFLSQATLRALIETDCPPDLIVLPEYPPAGVSSANEFGAITTQQPNPLLALATGVPVVYAPRARQRNLVTTLKQHNIDVILVSCWPYLIDASIVDSVAGAALNLHPSKLPLFRGPDPIGEQLKSGFRPFAVSLHRLSDQFDAGDLVAQLEITTRKKSPDRQMVEQDCANGGVQLFINLLDKDPALWPGQPQHN